MIKKAKCCGGNRYKIEAVFTIDDFDAFTEATKAMKIKLKNVHMIVCDAFTVSFINGKTSLIIKDDSKTDYILSELNKVLDIND